MTVSIRIATVDDKNRCLELLGMLSEATGSQIDKLAGDIFDQLLDKSRGQVLVADEEGDILGMASVTFNLAMRYGGEYCQLEELIVDPRARGKNVGGLLVQATLDHARQRGCAEYGLYLVETTEKNWPFYQKYGMEKVGTELRQQLT
ncbi:MAG: GNAT family N-acetyltransferase [Pseudomonadota bacterium]